MTPVLDQVRRMLRGSPRSGSRCLMCGNAIGEGEPRLRIHGQTYAHRRCATYRMRQRRGATDRIGHRSRRTRV